MRLSLLRCPQFRTPQNPHPNRHRYPRQRSSEYGENRRVSGTMDIERRKRMLGPITRGLPWRVEATVCKQHHEFLKLEEKKFIVSILIRWKGELQPRQAQWLNSIYDRLVFEHNVPYRPT